MLIFVLQAASAVFTPTIQATIPDVLPQEKNYTKALSLSCLAYDMESLVSPMLSSALFTAISFHDLFIGTVVGFLASAALVEPEELPVRTRHGLRQRSLKKAACGHQSRPAPSSAGQSRM